MAPPLDQPGCGLEDRSAAAGQADRWFAVYTKSRAERVVRDHLQDQGLEPFLPEHLVWSRRRDRRLSISVPLFPGYLFVRLAPRNEMLIRVLRTSGVVSILGQGPGTGRPQPVPDQEVESLKLMLAGPGRVSPEPYLRTGDRVRVISGPLTGCTGFVLHRRGAQRLVVSLHIMERSVAVDIPDADLERLS